MTMDLTLYGVDLLEEELIVMRQHVKQLTVEEETKDVKQVKDCSNQPLKLNSLYLKAQ
jgi:hypothetical protein